MKPAGSKAKNPTKDGKNDEKHRLELLIKDNFEVNTSSKDANQVDFATLFQESLPPAAKELVEFKASMEKDKDTSKEEEVRMKVENAKANLVKAKNAFPDTIKFSAKEMFNF